MDKNYWKDRYKDQWDKAQNKELNIKQLIEDKTGLKVEFHGLGAGEDEYISGSASDHGYKKGDSDLIIKSLNIKIEVTGPNIPVSPDKDLWIRPDKIESAKADSLHTNYIIHITEYNSKKIIRYIKLDEDFLNKFDTDEFKVIHPFIRGTKETYVSIPANSDFVKSIDSFFDHLNK